MSSKSNAGASSSSVNVDTSSLEHLCRALNDLSTESAEFVGARAAELARKNKETFEKKTQDIEAFLLQCQPNFASAPMIAAIKALFDTSFNKGYHPGCDRAVELIKYYLDGKFFVPEHVKIVPDIVFPLIRNVGYYCLEKKNKAEIGQSIMISALEQFYPIDKDERVLTSCHAALFQCVMKTGDYELAEPFIDIRFDYIANERRVEEVVVDESATTSSMDQAMPAYMTRLDKSKFKKMEKQGNNHPLPSPHMKVVYVVQYLYYGACILIELKKYQKALILLEVCSTIPANMLTDMQIDAFKKYILVSLLVHGSAPDILDKATSTRLFKNKMPEYKPFMDIEFSRSRNTHAKIERYANTHKDKLAKDRNGELIELIVAEMKKKSVLAVARLYSSVAFAKVKTLAHLKSDEDTQAIIEQLVLENRLNMEFDQKDEIITWSEIVPLPSKQEIEESKYVIDLLNHYLETTNTNWKSAQKTKGVMFDDEGLSMGVVPIE